MPKRVFAQGLRVKILVAEFAGSLCAAVVAALDPLVTHVRNAKAATWRRFFAMNCSSGPEPSHSPVTPSVGGGGAGVVTCSGLRFS